MPQQKLVTSGAPSGRYSPAAPKGLKGQLQRQNQFTNALQKRVDQPIQAQAAFQAGRGNLFDMLRRIGQAQAGRSAALGMTGSEADIGFAAARGQAAAGGVRDLIGQAAGREQFDIQALLQSLGLEGQLQSGIQGADDARRQRIASIVGQALGSVGTIIGSAVSKPAGGA